MAESTQNPKGSGGGRNLLVRRTGKHLSLVTNFAARAQDHLQLSQVHLLELETDPTDRDALDALLRMFGSIRRSARALRLEDIRAYAAAQERLLYRAVHDGVVIEEEALDKLLDAVYVLDEHFRYVNQATTSGKPLSHAESIEVLRGTTQGSPDPLDYVVEDPEGEASKPLGELLVETGITSRSDLDVALLEQKLEPRHKTFGEILHEELRVSEAQLERAKRTQDETASHPKLGEVLVEMGAIGEDDVQRTLHKQASAEHEKLGEVLVRSGRAPAKSVAHAVRRQSILRDLVRYGLARLAARFAPVVALRNQHTPAGEPVMLQGDPEDFRTFAARARDHLSSADMHLLALETNPADEEALGSLYRLFHSMGRIAGFLGLEDIRDFSMASERLFQQARKGEMAMDGPTLDVAFDAVDVLRRHVGYVEQAIEAGGGPLTREREMPQYVACIKSVMEGERSSLAVASIPAQPPGKKLGELLLESGVASNEALDAALREQQGPVTPSKLGDILVEEAKVSRAQVDAAVEAQKSKRQVGRLGDILIEAGLVSHSDIEEALERQQHPRSPLLGELLVRSGQVSARAVAHAVRSQRAGLARAAAVAVVAGTALSQAPHAHGQTTGVGGDSAIVWVNVESGVDTDEDGLTDIAERGLGTEPAIADTDQDGIQDGWEVQSGLDPLDATDAYEDYDQDTVTNIEESQLGTSPYEHDTDRDGFWDGFEYDYGTDAATADSRPDSGVFGDLDQSGAVTAQDVQIVINAALGFNTRVPANVDEIPGVSALDIQAVIRAALGI